MHLLKANQVSVSKEHGSAEAVAICMLLLKQVVSTTTLVSGVQFPSGALVPVAQLVEHSS
jgi:hypothetical protein